MVSRRSNNISRSNPINERLAGATQDREGMPAVPGVLVLVLGVPVLGETELCNPKSGLRVKGIDGGCSAVEVDAAWGGAGRLGRPQVRSRC